MEQRVETINGGLCSPGDQSLTVFAVTAANYQSAVSAFWRKSWTFAESADDGSSIRYHTDSDSPGP
jgi:hypothetical protein